MSEQVKQTNGQAKPSTAVAVKKSVCNTIASFYEQQSATLVDLLPAPMKKEADRLIKRAMVTISKSNDLLACTAASLWECILKAAEVGLAIDGVLAYAVPYKGVATLIIGYKGMIAVARRSGAIRDAYARLVLSGEQFKYYEQDGVEHLYHEPSGDEATDKVVKAYAKIVFPDGHYRYEVMSVASIDKIEALAKTDKVWKPHRGEMRKKTILRRALKTYGDVDAMLLKAFEYDDDLIEVEASAEVAKPPMELGRVSHKRLTQQEPIVEPDREPGEEPTQEIEHEGDTSTWDRADEKESLLAQINDALNSDVSPEELTKRVGPLFLPNQELLGDDYQLVQAAYSSRLSEQARKFAAPLTKVKNR